MFTGGSCRNFKWKREETIWGVYPRIPSALCRHTFIPVNRWWSFFLCTLARVQHRSSSNASCCLESDWAVRKSRWFWLGLEAHDLSNIEPNWFQRSMLLSSPSKFYSWWNATPQFKGKIFDFFFPPTYSQKVIRKEKKKKSLAWNRSPRGWFGHHSPFVNQHSSELSAHEWETQGSHFLWNTWDGSAKCTPSLT